MLKRKILSLTIVAIFCLTSLISLATAAEKTKVDKTKAATATPQPAQTVNSITQAAMKAGVNSCAGRINQVANFLTAGAQGVGALMFLPPKDPDLQLISASMEIPLKNASSAYASASFAPGQANYCGGMYETVVYWPQRCSEVADKNFGTFKKIGSLSKNIIVLDGGIPTKVFLMPAEKGCVSIKKEIVR